MTSRKTKTAAKKPAAKRPARKPVKRRKPVKKAAALTTDRKSQVPAGLVLPPFGEILPQGKGGEVRLAPQHWPIPKGYRILVKMAEPKVMTEGGVYLSDTSVEAEEYLVFVGKVLAMGPLCYKDPRFDGERFCDVDDWIAFGQHAGQLLEIQGERFKVINDDLVMCVLPSPELVKIYV